MALTRTVNGSNATYKFLYTATTAIMDKKADQAAHYFFNLGHGDHGTEEVPKTYDTLTAVEKCAIYSGRIQSLSRQC